MCVYCLAKTKCLCEQCTKIASMFSTMLLKCLAKLTLKLRI